ncbi:YgjV family protein [Vibrio mexicanus]|uniref:YgjV family protein n=1 Tax=Vibrio mexicanus TaxID=1004326 RepID=UPI00063C5B5D|nr:YgjV family protein [Vibrio mexicanus]
MENWFAQGVGIAAFLVGVSAFWQKDDMRMRYQMMVFCMVMGAHFLMMGAFVAGIGSLINGARSYVSMRTQSRRIMCFFIGLLLLMMLPNVHHPMELLTVLGSCLGTWALFSKQGIVLRAFILFNAVCWLTHNLWLGSIGGSLVEATFIVTHILTIYRLYRIKALKVETTERL